MSIQTAILISYIVAWLITSVSLYFHYLDVKTTMKVISLGGHELNESLKPYVKKDQPWLMVWGKLHTSDILIPLTLLFPPFVFGVLIKLPGTIKAVNINKKNIESYQ